MDSYRKQKLQKVKFILESLALFHFDTALNYFL